MNNEGTREEPKIQANNNNTTVGNIHVNGSVDGSMIIGDNNVIGFTAKQVSTLFDKIVTTFQSKPFDGQCPYKGLDVFEETDADLFFGREKLVEELISRVKESRTVFITGPSGSGKSSLVRAGLIHALKQGRIQESHSERWSYAIMKPGRDPLEALANALSRLKSPELGKYLRQNAEQVGTLHECVESILTDQKNQHLVLFVDQFEEIFTQTSKETEREIFLNLLSHTALKEDGRLIILFAMRSDFVSNCATYPQLNNLLNKQFIQVGPMQPDELVSAIAQPALRVGLPIEPDLVAKIINEMQGQAGALPLMQFALKDLFDSQKEKGGVIALTLSDYLKRGGIHKALERHADKSLAELGEDEMQLARSIFSGLIEIGRGTLDTRRTVTFQELVLSSEQAETVQSIIRKLADARLVTTDKQTVTISHERLIDAWPWLKRLINENRDVIALKNKIIEDAKEWDQNKQDVSYLYIGGRLASTREQLKLNKLTLSGLAQQFINASMEIEDNKQQEEKRRRQKELDDAYTLAESAQVQAKAERRALIITRWVLALVLILTTVIGYKPVKNRILWQQSINPEVISFVENNYLLGDDRAKELPNEYLVAKPYHILSFSIDVYPVTNRRYSYCVQAGVCRQRIESKSVLEDVRNADKLVVNITAIDAAEFCTWLGMRLPSEKEWEIAARAGAFKPISPDALNNNAIDFYEFTSSPFGKEGAEWIDISMDPPGILVLRGGQLNTNQPFTSYITRREQVIPTQAIQVVGFRCAADR